MFEPLFLAFVCTFAPGFAVLMGMYFGTRNPPLIYDQPQRKPVETAVPPAKEQQ
jgi:hypothetical protein